MHSINKYLFSTNCISRTILDPKTTAVNKIGKVPDLVATYTLVGGNKQEVRNK